MNITTDASNTGIGVCLNEIQNGECRPLGFFSRKPSEAEKRTSTFEKVLLAIFASVKRWRDLLDPRNVTIFTNHKCIVSAFNSDKQRLSDKQQRQVSFISEYTSDIVHVAGKDDVVASLFSRAASINASTTYPTCAPLQLQKCTQKKWNRDLQLLTSK